MKRDRLKKILQKKSKKKIVKLCKKFNICVKTKDGYIKKKDMITLLLNNKVGRRKNIIDGGAAAAAASIGKATAKAGGVITAVATAAVVIVSVVSAYYIIKGSVRLIITGGKGAGKGLNEYRKSKIRKKLTAQKQYEQVKEDERQIAEQEKEDEQLRIDQAREDERRQADQANEDKRHNNEREERREERQHQENMAKIELEKVKVNADAAGGAGAPSTSSFEKEEEKVEQAYAASVKTITDISNKLSLGKNDDTVISTLTMEQDENERKISELFKKDTLKTTEEKATFIVSSYRQIKSAYTLLRTTQIYLPSLSNETKKEIKLKILQFLQTINTLELSKFVFELDKAHIRLKGYVIRQFPIGYWSKPYQSLSKINGGGDTLNVKPAIKKASVISKDEAAKRLQRVFSRVKSKKTLLSLKEIKNTIINGLLEKFNKFILASFST